MYLNLLNRCGANDAVDIVFLDAAQSQAIVQLIQSLSLNDQEQIKSDFCVSSSSETHQVLIKYFTQTQIQQAFEEALYDGVKEWMETIAPHLSQSQKQKLLVLSQNVQSSLKSKLFL